MGFPSLQFAPYSNLAASIAGRLAAHRDGADPLHPWPEEVIVASNGVAQAITARLLERLPNGLAGLRLHTVETFAMEVVNAAGEFPRVANDAERRLAMRVAARSIDDPMMETRGASVMLERSYRDVRDSTIAISSVASASSLRNRERTRKIVRAWEEYERLITRLGCTDPADLLARATELISRGAQVRPQIVAGFYDMTGAQQAVIAALRSVEKLAEIRIPVDVDEPRSYSFAQPFIQRFTDASFEPQPVLKIKSPAWTIAEHKTREDEARGVCRAIRELLDAGKSPASIGIVGRSLQPYDLHLFERFAAENGFSISASAPAPLIGHRIGRAVATLLRLRERDFPRSDVLEIVRGGLKVKTRINVDKADVETRQAQIAGGRAAVLGTRADRSFAVGDYINLVAELEELTANLDAPLLTRLADSFRIEDESDIAACEAVDAVADLFTRAEKWNRPLDVNAILDALEQITTQHSAPSTQNPTVWAGDVMTFRGRSFQNLFAMRMQDDILPQRRVEDPLLADADRRQLGVREIGNGRDEEQLLFHLICSGASNAIHFSYASSDGFGKPLRASHYLKTFALEHAPEKKAEILRNFSRFVSECGGKAAALPSKAVASPPHSKRALQLLSRAGTGSVFDGYVTSAIVQERVATALQSISPTHLEDFGECPQKFFMKHILGVRDIDDPEHQVQINHRDKGTIDHRILERFYRSLPKEDIDAAASALPRLSEPLRARLESLVDESFDELEQRAPAHNRAMRAIERRATKRVLRDFVAADLTDLLTQHLTPSFFEYRFGRKHETPDHAEPFVIDIHGVPLKVEGTIDRIDRGDGRLRIVDYKSGKALRHVELSEKIDRGVRLQLALYAMAAAEFFNADAADVSGAIKPLVIADSDPARFSFLLGEKKDLLRETLEIFVDAIRRGAFPAFPNEGDKPKDFNSCRYCPVNHSCRTKHDSEERRAILAAGEPRSLLRQTP